MANFYKKIHLPSALLHLPSSIILLTSALFLRPFGSKRLAMLAERPLTSSILPLVNASCASLP